MRNGTTPASQPDQPTEMRHDPNARYEEYRLVGPMKGKSGVFFGVRFKNGIGMVPINAENTVGRLLVSDYSALPADEAEALDKEAETKSSAE